MTSAEDDVTPASSHVEDHTTAASDHVTSQVTSHDPSDIFEVVEDPVSSVVRTQGEQEEEGKGEGEHDKPVEETSLTCSEETPMETDTTEGSQATLSSSGGDAPTEIRSFTPPPNTLVTGSTAEAGSQTDSGGMGNGNGTGGGVAADDTLPLPSEGEEEKRMDTVSELLCNIT